MAVYNPVLQSLQPWVTTGALTPLSDSPLSFQVVAKALREVCCSLYRHPDCFIDMCVNITAVDMRAQDEYLLMCYHLCSVPLQYAITLQTPVSKLSPQIDSVADIWKSANWMEREVYDMMGIAFIGHPDLRRILMPHDWQGHPLRKDYVPSPAYRGISTGERLS